MARLIDADDLVDALMTYTWRDEDERIIDDADEKREYIEGWLPNVPTVCGWINVKDRLPDRKWTDYLVATRLCDGTFGVNIAWLNNDKGEWSSNDEWICVGREVVTHWMPLPEPPKESENGNMDV